MLRRRHPAFEWVERGSNGPGSNRFDGVSKWPPELADELPVPKLLGLSTLDTAKLSLDQKAENVESCVWATALLAFLLADRSKTARTPNSSPSAAIP